MSDVLKVGLRIELTVDKTIEQPWHCFPGNLTVGINAPHRISGRFEFS
jgi:hypothetical protein